MKSLIVKYQNHLILEILMDMILLATLEIKEDVAHATQFHSLKLWKLDWNWNMENSHQCFLLNNLWHVTIWMKDAMEDGLILMYFWQKMDIWFQKNVHHINKKQREIIAVTMAVVNQSLKFKDLILLEEDGETHLKKKWWRKFWEMDQLMAISKHQKCLAFIN